MPSGAAAHWLSPAHQNQLGRHGMLSSTATTISAGDLSAFSTSVGPTAGKHLQEALSRTTGTCIARAGAPAGGLFGGHAGKCAHPGPRQYGGAGPCTAGTSGTGAVRTRPRLCTLPLCRHGAPRGPINGRGPPPPPPPRPCMAPGTCACMPGGFQFHMGFGHHPTQVCPRQFGGAPPRYRRHTQRRLRRGVA